MRRGWTWVDAATSKGADATGGAGDRGAKGRLSADFLILDMMVLEQLQVMTLSGSLCVTNRDQIDAVVVNGRLRLVAGQPIDGTGTCATTP